MKKSNPDEIHTIMKKFYNEIAGTINKEYLHDYKRPIIIDFV